MATPPNPSNEQQWFRSEIEPNIPFIRNWLKAKYGFQLEIDDVIQDTLVKATHAYREGKLTATKAYLFAVARNRAVDLLRKQRIRIAEPIGYDEVFELMDTEEDVSEAVAKNHELEILSQAIGSLPSQCRRVITYGKIYGMSHEQIAAKMGISKHTVASQVAIGISKCLKFLKMKGISQSW